LTNGQDIVYDLGILAVWPRELRLQPKVAAVAKREALGVLLDRRHFVLDEEKYRAFLEVLASAPKVHGRLKKLLSEKAPWEEHAEPANVAPKL
jgi:hypothetical protein